MSQPTIRSGVQITELSFTTPGRKQLRPFTFASDKPRHNADLFRAPAVFPHTSHYRSALRRPLVHCSTTTSAFLRCAAPKRPPSSWQESTQTSISRCQGHTGTMTVSISPGVFLRTMRSSERSVRCGACMLVTGSNY